MPSTKASTKPTHRMAISDVWCGIDRPVVGGGDDSEGLARSMQRAWRLVECAPHDLLQEFRPAARRAPAAVRRRSEEHTSELQSLMRNSYAVFCLKKKKK